MTAALKVLAAQLLAKIAPRVVALAAKAVDKGLDKAESELDKRLGA
jgi:hypothetical protein